MNRTIICLAIGLLYLQLVPSMVWCNDLPFALPSKQDQLTEGVEDEKFVLIVKLDEENINQIRQTGHLKTKIPKVLINKVGAIRFQGPTRFLNESIRIETNVDKRVDTLRVVLNNSILDRLNYQPIELMVYDSGFDTISLVYDGRATVRGIFPMTPADSGDKDSQILFVRINSNRGIYGAIKDLKTLSIKTGFGDVQIPTTQIAGIRFNNQTAQVILRQGDVISGTITAEKLIVKSLWGEKELALSEIESITLKHEKQFVADADSPGGWRLQRVVAKAKRAPKTKTELPRQSKQ